MEPTLLRTVLCIDDDVANVALRRDLLESLGFKVLVAHNGPDGLNLIRERHPDILLLDYAMPGMDGGEVAEHARRLAPELPIVMLSAHVDVPAKALQHVSCYIVKGDPVQHLFGKIRELTAVDGRKPASGAAPKRAKRRRA